MVYTPSIFDSLQPDENQNIFKENIVKSKYISYQFTNRFNFFTKYNNHISINPKSIINSNPNIGSYLQFPKHAVALNYFNSWENFSLMKNSFSKKLEINFFNSLGYYLFPKILSSYDNLTEIFTNSNETKILVLEEIVDLEALPLVSLFYQKNQQIYLTQHSSNPFISPLLNSQNKSIVSKIFANSNFALSMYQKNLQDVEILRNPFTEINIDSFQEYRYKNVITIIENDFFRRFGFPYDIKIIYLEISNFIKLLIT
jgi:hypothetical protein